MTDPIITSLELRFPDAETALAVARAIGGNPAATELPPDGQIGGVRYDIAVLNGDGSAYAPPIDDDTPGERLAGYHVIGLWRGPPETLPAALLPFLLPDGALGVRFG